MSFKFPVKKKEDTLSHFVRISDNLSCYLARVKLAKIAPISQAYLALQEIVVYLQKVDPVHFLPHRFYELRNGHGFLFKALSF